MFPLLITDNLTQYPVTCFVDNMYFIKVLPKKKALNEIFLILDLEKALLGGKVGYYLGRITQWLGFFWDRKKLYQRKILNIPYTNKHLRVFLNYYLPEITNDRLYMPYTEEIKFTFKDVESIMTDNYKLDKKLTTKDFISSIQISDESKKSQGDESDEKLARIKQMFGFLFGKKKRHYEGTVFLHIQNTYLLHHPQRSDSIYIADLFSCLYKLEFVCQIHMDNYSSFHLKNSDQYFELCNGQIIHKYIF